MTDHSALPTKVTLVFHVDVELSFERFATAEDLADMHDADVIECWAEDPFDDLASGRVQVIREYEGRTVEGQVYRLDGTLGNGKAVPA